MQISGTVTTILAIERGVSKGGKDWSKKTFIISFKNRNFENILVLTCKEDLQVTLNTKVVCDINLSSREYNGRYYTEAHCWKIAIAEGAQQQAQPQEEQGDDLPF